MIKGVQRTIFYADWAIIEYKYSAHSHSRSFDDIIHYCYYQQHFFFGNYTHLQYKSSCYMYCLISIVWDKWNCVISLLISVNPSYYKLKIAKSYPYTSIDSTTHLLMNISIIDPLRIPTRFGIFF